MPYGGIIPTVGLKVRAVCAVASADEISLTASLEAVGLLYALSYQLAALNFLLFLFQVL